MTRSIEERAARHAALGDVTRLQIVDLLAVSDRSPSELQDAVGVSSNLLAHHLDVLAAVGLIDRFPSSGDRRRRYVRLRIEALTATLEIRRLPATEALFVCSANSARSQLAAALWRALTDAPAISAGTRPASAVHPGAIAAARRARLDISDAHPTKLTELDSLPELVITVCDRAHEELAAGDRWLHWSIPDPVSVGTPASFDATVAALRTRIEASAVCRRRSVVPTPSEELS